jgi:hypothetical protein
MLDSGLSIYHHSFVAEDIEPDLFSALITASSMQMKLETAPEQRILQEQFEVEEYVSQVCYGEYIAGIIVSSDGVSQAILTRFLKFLALFEEEYKFIISKWHGDRSFFDQEWATEQLLEHLRAPKGGMRLSDDAIHKAENAKQIRLVQLIKRHVKKEAFSKDLLIELIEENLLISTSEAETYIDELINSKIFSQS